MLDKMIGRVTQRLGFLADVALYFAKELLARLNRLQCIVTYAVDECFFYR